MDYKTISTDYYNIEKIEFEYNNPFILEVNLDNIKFEFLLNLKRNIEKAVIFGAGAYDSTKYNPPVFQRHAWMDDLDCSTIYYNDPTLYLGEMNLGWGYGEKERHYLVDISKILISILNKVGLNNKDVLFYGSSGGGFMSMLLAGLLKSKALVNNPQTIVKNFYIRHVNNLKKAVVPNGEFEEERINTVEFFKKINYIPQIKYVQNLASQHDMEKHLVPFINGLQELDESLFKNRITLEFYANNKQGHNPLEKIETISLIKEMLQSMER